MEKAFAKLHGDYDTLNGGSPTLALNIITGFPVFTYFHKNWIDSPDQVELMWQEMN
jgi:hypothetical protein